MPNHLNGAGRIFGGQLVAWIDVIGGIAARRHCGCAVTTAAIDNLQFREPVYVNEVVVLRARVTFVGRTSMEVRVDTFVEGRVRHAQARQYGVSDGNRPRRGRPSHARAAASV